MCTSALCISMHRGDFLSENQYFNQEYQDTSGIFEIRAMFGDQISLEEILAQRALREDETLDLKEETAYF